MSIKWRQYGKWNQDEVDELLRQLPANHYDDREPTICKKFGCGRHLGPTEQLFSEFCFEHSKTTITNLKSKK
jgi:hypothetical protein